MGDPPQTKDIHAFYACRWRLGMTSKGTLQEKIGWPIIFGIFFTIPAIPLAVLLLREVAGIR
jgi:hypothetical protein